jgi:hypothetical protein
MASQQNVNPAQAQGAQGAQIPLQNFQLPDFPPQASGLMALTLTSDIKMDEYQDLLKQPSNVPKSMPKSIQSLTLELFSLGYPPGFLTSLIEQLPYIKSLVLYSQLFGGVTPESEADAVTFFSKAVNIRALHLLDVFAKEHFIEKMAPSIRDRTERGLMFLEVNYSFRHEDEMFLVRVPGAELPLLVSPSLITCSFNISLPDVTDDPDDPANLPQEGAESNSGKKEGVMAFNRTMSKPLIKALTDEKTRPVNLKLLNTTLYTLTLEMLRKILECHKGLLVLSATVEVEPTVECKDELLETLALCSNLEQVEIVGNPSLQFFMAVRIVFFLACCCFDLLRRSLLTMWQQVSNPKRRALQNAFPSGEDMKRLTEKCKNLNSFKASILRTNSMGTVEWTKEEGSSVWKGGIKGPEEEQEEIIEAEAGKGADQKRGPEAESGAEQKKQPVRSSTHRVGLSVC